MAHAILSARPSGVDEPAVDAMRRNKLAQKMAISRQIAAVVDDDWSRRRGDVLAALRLARLIAFDLNDQFIAGLAGFEREADARRFLDEMRLRFEEFGLSRHPEKTRTHRVRALCGAKPQAARARQAGDLQLSWLHSRLRADAPRRLHAELQEPKRPPAGEAQASQEGTGAADASRHSQARRVAVPRGVGLLPIPCGADKRRRAFDVPQSRTRYLATRATAAQSERRDGLEKMVMARAASPPLIGNGVKSTAPFCNQEQVMANVRPARIVDLSKEIAYNRDDP